jgi:Mg-chelatase subunit ChlD
MQHDFILLDRSGSMSNIWAEAISSVNAYVAKLAAENVDTGVTLATFDTDQGKLAFDILRDRIIPSTWKPVAITEASPRGMTPLNDATGRIVDLANKGGYDKVAIIIMTDGHENASQEITVERAKALLDECRTKNWQVIFLGANFDNTAQAGQYGNAKGSTVQATADNLAPVMSLAGEARSAYAASGAPMVFSEEQKARLKSQAKT